MKQDDKLPKNRRAWRAANDARLPEHVLANSLYFGRLAKRVVYVICRPTLPPPL